LLVSINGTLQQPVTSYDVNGNQLIFTEIPQDTDVVEVRSIAAGVIVTALQRGSTEVQLTAGNVNISGNLIPLTSNLYDIGSNDELWKDLYLSGTVVHSGNTITVLTSGNTVTVDSFPTSIYRTAKYILQATSESEYQSAEILVTHDGTAAYNTVYGVINTGNILGNISTTISGGSVLVQYTASYNNTILRLATNYIVV
jgi:hypothetical protein